MSEPSGSNLWQLPVVRRFAQAARQFHARYDPSHDFEHVRRVSALAIRIATELETTSSGSIVIDKLVILLAALAHDMLDAKYLPKNEEPPPSAEALLAPLYGESDEDVSLDRRKLVARIVENVSYSKEVKRIAAGLQTEWHQSCLELHCVQDADKLDAIGAFGIMRCAAYSGATNRPLFVANSESPAVTIWQGVSNESASTTSTPPAASAIDHFDDKLFKLEGMMKTNKGREMARQRTQCMQAFVEQVNLEWADVERTFA